MKHLPVLRFARFRGSAPFAELLPVETPWTTEYADRHANMLNTVLGDPGLVRPFRGKARLPTRWGVSLDERVVEYPWALARLGGRSVLDAGSTLNHGHVLDHFLPGIEDLTIVTLTPEGRRFGHRGVTYEFADLRALPFANESFDSVLSISTLEHIGMDNSSYGGPADRAAVPRDEVAIAIGELKRVLVPGGQLLVTVPYGVREDHGWFRQFDQDDVEHLLDAIGPHNATVDVFAYQADGWQRSTLRAARTARYRDFTSDPRPVPDWAAAARAVVCISAVTSK